MMRKIDDIMSIDVHTLTVSTTYAACEYALIPARRTEIIKLRAWVLACRGKLLRKTEELAQGNRTAAVR